MGALFGTDGIRGGANRYPLDCETAVKAGRAIASYFHEQQTGGSHRFVIGRDTRISGDMLVSALASGICSMGKTVYTAGVIPTPGIAFLTSAEGFDAGIMISASHNPFHDNGIKLFKSDGFKLSDEAEQAIEQKILDSSPIYRTSENIERTGSIVTIDDASKKYLRYLMDCRIPGFTLSGKKIVIDCSNGAASFIAPLFFQNLDATVKVISFEPNGININDNCGSQHPEVLAKVVLEEKADVGLAFDGDADRLIAVDETGTVLAGDQVLAICAKDMKEKGQLENPVIVTTVMSNMGLGVALKKMGLSHVKSNVGDRYVMREMIKSKAVVGGEDSGHMIFLNHHTTGDGMLASVKLLEAMQSSGKPLSELATVMTVFPQCLINVDVRSKPEITSVAEVVEAQKAVEKELGDRGRVLVRYSGTQPQCRVMVEGPTKEETERLCRQIASVVEKELG